MICRDLFLRAYGYFAVMDLTRELEKYFIGLFSIPWKKPAFYFLNLLENGFVALIIMLIPAIIYGYYVKGSKKHFLFCSIFSCLGLMLCDVLCSISMGDVTFAFHFYLPVWYGILVIFMWISLFWGVYSLGNILRVKRDKRRI